MAKKTSKRMPKRTPKPEEVSEEKVPSEATSDDLQAQRERIKRAILPGNAEKVDEDLDFDLDAEVVDEGEGKEKDDMMGPHRRKQMAPLVQEYIGGLRKMLDNSALREEKEFNKYGEGLREVTSAGLGMLDILIRKWMGKVPYAEEGVFAANAATVWYGGKYLNERLEARDGARPGGGGKNDDPAKPPGS